ncbi:uncharacterized protein B0T15DRAFT_491061 [Chaetomium strumarium]|uniref:Uncharacterized protein n=1 Tax=Chaetomium strumarium TaxID=1170767 RepID=A0AAJ0M4G1_9PEZI|nr:hypothetical protein B0T15DRAFT_491061 [Chaetomium strumarium]
METREEKLARWVDPPKNEQTSLRVLTGSLSLSADGSVNAVRISDDKIQYDQIEDHLLKTHSNNKTDDSLWHFRVLSLPRLQNGRLVLSLPKPTFHQIQSSWHLHPRTTEVFLSNNGVLATFTSPSNHPDTITTSRTSLLLKVANSRSTGFDCASITLDPSRRTTYILYHHLTDEPSVFATLLSSPELCITPHFFAFALYRSHHQHIEVHRNTIDDTIQRIERETKYGNPGKLMAATVTGEMGPRPSLDGCFVLEDPRRTIQRLSYCQTDLAVVGHVARCGLELGGWIVQGADDSGYGEVKDGACGDAFSKSLKAARVVVREEVEYIRRRTAMLLSQVEQMMQRAQSQTDFMLSNITQNDAEYTAAIAVDGKRDSIAMKTISILGIVYLPPTFVATLFSMGMFDWGTGAAGGEGSSSALRTSPSIWIYFVVAVPLTLATFLVWMLWARRENRKTSQRFRVYRTRTVESLGTAAAAESTVGLVSGEKMV